MLCSCFSHQAILNSDETTHVLENLEPDTPYDVSVTAIYPDESESEDLLGTERTCKIHIPAALWWQLDTHITQHCFAQLPDRLCVGSWPKARPVINLLSFSPGEMLSENLQWGVCPLYLSMFASIVSKSGRPSKYVGGKARGCFFFQVMKACFVNSTIHQRCWLWDNHHSIITQGP